MDIPQLVSISQMNVRKTCKRKCLGRKEDIVLSMINFVSDKDQSIREKMRVNCNLMYHRIDIVVVLSNSSVTLVSSFVLVNSIKSFTRQTKQNESFMFELGESISFS